MVLCGGLNEEILTALGHLPEYPTCSKAMCWRGIRCAVNFAWRIEPSLQYSSTPCSRLLFLCNWIGSLTRVHPFSSDGGFSESQRIPEFCLGFPGAFHRTLLPYSKSAKCAISRRLMALRIPLPVQFLQKNESASSSRQSLTLFITRRNLAQ